MDDLIKHYVSIWNQDDKPLEFEQFLATLKTSESNAILEFMANETERTSL